MKKGNGLLVGSIAVIVLAVIVLIINFNLTGFAVFGEKSFSEDFSNGF